MNIKKISVVAVLLLGGIVLLLAANWLAGVLLFLAYRQDPSAAGLWTIQSAWISASDTKTMQKVTGASVIAFLMSPAASYVHGAQIVIDGGIDALMRPTSF